jgi:hypothetical protein
MMAGFMGAGGILLFTTMEPLIQYIPRIKWPEHEAIHPPLSSTTVKNAWSTMSTHPFYWREFFVLLCCLIFTSPVDMIMLG